MKHWICLALALTLALTAAIAWAEDAQQSARKVAYLTFDDGPQEETPELLAILEELDVPATFFLLGLNVREHPEYAKMIVDAGYAVGCHTMSHSYNRLKESTDYVERDIARFIDEMRKHTDPAFTTDLYRFPGGSTSYKYRTKKTVVEAGCAWFDWNAMNGDAQYSFKSDEEMLAYTIKDIGKQEVVIILMHDGKTRTRRILPDLVAYLRENGYEFRMLSTSEEDREILKRCEANMMLPEVVSDEATRDTDEAA